MSANGRRIAVCPGTYDPVTNGHVDIIARAAAIFDEVVVAVTTGSFKKRPLFDADERIALVRASVVHLENVRVEGFNSLVTEHADGGSSDRQVTPAHLVARTQPNGPEPGRRSSRSVPN